MRSAGIAALLPLREEQIQAGDDVESQAKVLKDIQYASGTSPATTLDLHLPSNAPLPLPVVLLIHGGAFRGGSKESATGFFLAKHGYALASINYQLAREAKFPAQLHQAKAAVRFLRATAGKYGLDAARIAAMGSSAGALFANLLGVTSGHREWEGRVGEVEESSAVTAVVDLWGPSDLLTLQQDALNDPNIRPKMPHGVAGSPEADLLGQTVAQNPELARSASPITYVSAQTCPFLLLHGDHDPLIPVKQSYRFFSALKDAGAEANLFIAAGYGHGVRSPESEAMMAAFLDRHLKNPEKTRSK